MLLFDLLILAAVASPPAIATPASDIRPAWSADGALRYFGALHPDGRHEVMEQARDGDAWGAPRSSAINAGGAVKDFDPFVAPDGTLLWFSDRAGGAGGTDLWQRVPGGTPAPVTGVNSAGDEWAPAVSPDGHWLLFSSDRATPGAGHRLYLSQRVDGAWSAPVALDTGDGAPRYDFDACFVGTEGKIAFSRSDDPGRGSVLWTGTLDTATHRVRNAHALPAPFANDSGYALGCAWHASEPGVLYVSTALGDAPQRLDIHALPLP